MDTENKLIVFQERKIRRIWLGEEWFYAVLDVVEVLTDSTNATDYFKKMRKRDEFLREFVGTNCPQVEMQGEHGKKRKTLAANKRSLFRIIQSIPSAKAEPFKLWLAQVGSDRIDEIENPELAAERARQLYKAKGYSDDWIEMRLKSIDVRAQLTDEWKGRGVQENREYAILTAEISKATFGMTPSEYKDHKSLKRENLRDHMTNLELIFSMLGEETTRDEAIVNDAKGFIENREAAIKGGGSAGDALHAYQKSTGRKVISEANFLGQIEQAKQKNKVLDAPKED